MEFLDSFGINLRFLDEDLQLVLPNLDRTNAGALPAIAVPFIGKKEVINEDILVRIDQDYENIVFVMADGIGAFHLKSIGGYLWQNVQSSGTVAYSVFPTMTSTNLTSMAYGSLPACHGLVGYNIYNERLDALFNSLNGMYRKNGSPKSIFDEHAIPDFISGTPLPVQLGKHFSVKLLIPSQLPFHGLPDIIGQGADRILYNDLEDGIRKAIPIIRTGSSAFLGIYLGIADHVGHRYGPDSPQYVQAIKAIDRFVQNLVESLKGTSTLILLTSDHGQSQLKLEQCKFMNREEWYRHKKNGVTLGTSGRMIHAYSDDHDKSRSILENLANDKGLILSAEKAIQLMGSKKCGTQWLNRVGTHVLIFEDGYIHDVPEVVELEHYDTPYIGQHGSLSLKEIFVPVGIWNI